MTTTTDTRPAEGWTEPDKRGNVTVVVHDCTVMDAAPTRDGFTPYFIGRYGIGPGSWTRWYYSPVEPTP